MEREPVNVSIRRIELEDVAFDGLGPLEIKAIASEIEQRINDFAKKRNTPDTFKLLAYAALFYAVQAYTKTNTAGTKTKEDTRQLDAALEKLNHCLASLPMK